MYVEIAIGVVNVAAWMYFVYACVAVYIASGKER
jgi:hypothetical protein